MHTKWVYIRTLRLSFTKRKGFLGHLKIWRISINLKCHKSHAKFTRPLILVLQKFGGKVYGKRVFRIIKEKYYKVYQQKSALLYCFSVCLAEGNNYSHRPMIHLGLDSATFSLFVRLGLLFDLFHLTRLESTCFVWSNWYRAKLVFVMKAKKWKWWLWCFSFHNKLVLHVSVKWFITERTKQ